MIGYVGVVGIPGVGVGRTVDEAVKRIKFSLPLADSYVYTKDTGVGTRIFVLVYPNTNIEQEYVEQRLSEEGFQKVDDVVNYLGTTIKQEWDRGSLRRYDLG